MHYWGDKGVDWDGINDAAAYIGLGLRKWRVNITQYKEKYGTVRVYGYLGLTSFHQLTHPGYVFNQWPEWLWKLQFTWLARKVIQGLNFLVYPLHKRLYRRYYRKAVEKWPHLREEILCCADFDELLEGL